MKLGGDIYLQIRKQCIVKGHGGVQPCSICVMAALGKYEAIMQAAKKLKLVVDVRDTGNYDATVDVLSEALTKLY